MYICMYVCTCVHPVTYSEVLLCSAICCRCFVISHLPKLEFLDDAAVSSEEQEEAQRVYGKRRLKPK